MMRIVRFFIASILGFFVALLVSVGLDRVVIDGPASAGRIFSRSTQAECDRLKEGMTAESVLERIDLIDRAPWQTLEGDMIEFRAGSDGTCRLQMDHLTGRVVAAKFDKTRPTDFDVSGRDSYPEE